MGSEGSGLGVAGGEDYGEGEVVAEVLGVVGLKLTLDGGDLFIGQSVQLVNELIDLGFKVGGVSVGIVIFGFEDAVYQVGERTLLSRRNIRYRELFGSVGVKVKSICQEIHEVPVR